MTQFNNKQINKTRRWPFMVLVLMALSYFAHGQVGTPTYFNATGTSANTFPWNTTSSNKVQYIYAPSIFSTSGGGAGTPAPVGYIITKVYVKFSGTVNATNTYTNFTISMGQNMGSINNYPQAPTTTGVAFNTGLTQVFYQASGFALIGITANAWYGFTLQTPFAYDPTQALIVEMKSNNATAAGNSVATVTTAGISQRIYAGYAATTGTANTLLTPFGFDMIPGSACTAPPTPGTATITNATPCTGQNFDLSLTGSSVGSGQTYQWQSGPTASGPWSNVGGVLAVPSLTTNASSPTYYQCEVTCSGNSQYSTPVLANVPPAFPGGNYTIDNTQAASATNFTSFASALAAMSCGISGPITLDVVPGTGPYNEQVLIPSTIGTNATNTLTINGNGNTLSVPANAVNLYTLGLDGADYVTVNDLTIEGTDATYALACHLWNNADNNAFNNCTFKAPLNSTATTTSPFSISGSPTAVATTGNSGSNNVLTGCTTIGGYYSLVFYGNSGLINTGNKVLNCTAQDFYTYGIYALYQNGWEVTGSIVERPTRTTLTTCYGIYASTGCVGSIIRNNKVRNTYAQAPTNTGATYCIYVGTDGTIGNENQIYNNLVYDIKSAGIVAGIYASGADYTVIYHNTISLDDAGATAGTTYGIYNTGTVGGIDIRNNLVSITRGGTGTKYCLYYTGTLQNSDNNVLYLNAPAGTNNTGYNGTAYTTLAAWQTASGKDLNSVDANPVFNNPSTADFTPTSVGVSNIGGSVGIATDINGQSRNLAAPDPGAIEFILASLDVSFNSITSPVSSQGCYGSNETVVAVIKNSGNDPLDFSLNPVTVTVNVSGPASYTISETINFGTLGVNQTQTANLIPSIDLTVDGVYSFTGNVSVAGDANPGNDNLTPFNVTIGITPGTITSSLSSPVCYSQNPTFTLTGQFGGTRQWQISTVSATGPWTNVGTGGTTYVATGQTQDYWIQVESNCNFNYAYSNVIAVVVNNPALLSTTPGSRCGIGTVDLSATANGSATVNWYADATGGLPLATGTNFTTPVISSTTTYYAAATDGGATLNTGLPNRVGATTNSGYSDVGLMFDALQPFTLNSVAIYPVATTPSGNVTATIALKNSAGTILQSTTISVPTSTSPGIKTLVPLGFNVPMGTGHRLVFTSASGGGITGFIRELTTGFTYPYTIPGVSSITSAYTSGASSAYYYYFYDWSVTYGCEGSRSPVVATINTAPTVTVSALSTTLCPGESTDISVSSSNDPNYDYSWTSTPAVFTATGAGPHTVTPNAVVTYTVTATDNTAGPYSGCVSVGTVTITSAATLSGGTISADLSEHCFTGSSILTSSGTSGGPIQWEESTVSSSGPWTPVGTSATTYTTPTLTQTTYYRVGVTCGANTDYSAVKTITVNDPTVSATAPGETCGSGTVTLGATPNNAAYNIRWYAAASGGSPLATGLTFTTPVLASTTTYYAAPVANSGGSGTNVAIPLASGTTTGVYHHMFLVSATTSVYVSSIGIKCNNTVGTLTAWDIYYRPDNYQTVSGANTNSAGWTLLSSVTGVPSVGATNYTTISVPLNLAIPSGATYSFYVAPGAGATHQYATSAIGTTVASNSDLALKAGNRGSALFNCATNGGMACVKLNYSTGCEGVRVPVVATVGPVVSISGLGASYYTTDAPVTLSGTPSGGSFSGPGITGSDFDPSAAGVGTHTITYSVPGTTCTATQTVTVNPPPISTLNLKFMLQGFYLGSGAMQPVLNNQGMANPTTDCDDVTVELHDASSPYGLAYSFTGVVKTDGTVTCTFPSAVIGNSYYLVVLQRNHIQTWSASPITMAVNNSYDFSTAANKAYGDNQWEVETGVFGFYAGDVNQDLTVDGFDYIDMDPNIVAGDCGYYATDLTGDGCVDVFDFLMASPNIDAGITIQAP